MGSDSTDLATEFDQHRSRLIGLAYRLTGRLSDAEDAVQEAWLRLTGLSDHTEIHNLTAWLTTVVSRICLDRMRSAAERREQYVGPWLPEPIVTTLDDQDPLNVVVRQEDMRVAALRVLHELSPDQRLAFVLHDAFDVPFAEIAEVLECSAASARQHASRARRAMAEEHPPPRVADADQQRVLDELLTAVAARDLGAITRVLHPQVTLYGDGGGQVRTALRPIVGVDKVARFAQGLANKFGDELFSGARQVLVNGDLGLLTSWRPDSGVQPSVLTIDVEDGKVRAIYDIGNPDKLSHLAVE